MKSPSDLGNKLARQWQKGELREERLIGNADWPIRLPIGLPSPRQIAQDWTEVAAHVRAWRSVRCGRVVWDTINFRATGNAVEMPIAWEIADTQQWIDAAGNKEIAKESSILSNLISASDPLFSPLLIRKRSLWKGKPIEEILQATNLATILQPGCAQGNPLRALGFGGVDTKFYERNRSIIIQLLDERFDGEVSSQGLEAFLGASNERDNWLLVVDLDGSILPFSQQRIRSSELLHADLLIPRLLIIENERCLHLLPRPLPKAIAVLGAGNDLGWLAASWVGGARVAYWGDIDTWGLTLLANARNFVPNLTPLLMSRHLFEQYQESHAVPEPVPAGVSEPSGLTPEEKNLYQHLLLCSRGRVEQEFIGEKAVSDALVQWLDLHEFR